MPFLTFSSSCVVVARFLSNNLWPSRSSTFRPDHIKSMCLEVSFSMNLVSEMSKYKKKVTGSFLLNMQDLILLET